MDAACHLGGVFMPLYDDSPIRRPPVVVWLVMLVCIALYLWLLSLPPALRHVINYNLGLVPAVFFGRAELDETLLNLPPWATLFTCMFLHSGFLHLAFNVMFLYIFGRSVEGAIGSFRFLLLYLVSGVGAEMVEALGAPETMLPMVGASGAIAGVLGAHVLLFPNAVVRVFVFFFFFFRIVRVPATAVLGIWFLIQILSGITETGSESGVAFLAHTAGFIIGMALSLFLKLPEKNGMANSSHMPSGPF